VSESTAELAVHFAAAVHRADPAALTDSKAFMTKVSALGPDTPGFVDRVSVAVRDAVAAQGTPATSAQGAVPTPVVQPGAGSAGPGQEGATSPVSPANEQLLRQASRRAQLRPDFSGEVTVQDVQDAEPWVVAEWAQAGKLAGLGLPAQKRRGRR